MALEFKGPAREVVVSQDGLTYYIEDNLRAAGDLADVYEGQIQMPDRARRCVVKVAREDGGEVFLRREQEVLQVFHDHITVGNTKQVGR